jgi:hypothetical protein
VIVGFLYSVSEIVHVPHFSSRFCCSNFDQAIWKKYTYVDDVGCTRGRMAEDLRRGDRLERLNRAQVTDLLGPPDVRVYVQGCVAYDLGACRNVDNDILEICFDEKDRVRSTRIN